MPYVLGRQAYTELAIFSELVVVETLVFLVR
jgi:hypothetical protein